MKPKVLPLVLAALAFASSAHAATFTWDGGAGTWDTTTTNWTSLAWGNTNADEAIFSGTAGTVTLNTGTGVIANKLTFNSDGYLINSNVAADVLTLAGTTPTVTVGSGFSATINAITAGTAGLTKAGAGTLVLNGANPFTGTTTLSGGTLVVGNVDALSTALTGSGSSNLRLATDSSVTAFSINTGTNQSFTINSDRATSGAAITHALGSASLGGGSSTVTFTQGSNVSSGTAGVSITSLSLSGGVAAGGSTTTTLNPTSATVAITGNVTRNNNAGNTTKVLALSGTIAGNAINGTISNGDADDIVAVTKSGASTWALNHANSNYTGITTISAGVLEVASLVNGGSNSSIGASTNAAANLVFGAPSATLRYIGTTNTTTDHSFTTSSGTGGGATIASSGTGTLGLDDTVAIGYGTTNQTRTLTLDGSNTGTNTFSKTLANNGTGVTSLTKNGVGTWVLDGAVANTHTGTTAINGGTLILSKTSVNAIGGNLTVGNAGVGLDILQLNASDQIADTSVTTFNGTGANAGIFRLNNNSETLAGLVSTGGAGIVENGNAAASISNLTLSFASGTQTFSGILQDHDGSGSGILALTKAGAGTQALTGTNTYTGVTTISAGAIAATVLANGGTASSIGASSNAASNLVFGAPGAVLRYTGTTDVTLDRGFTTSSGVGGGASFSSSGTGTLSFDNTVAINLGTTAQTRALTLGGTNTGLNTFSKTITNNGGSATSLTKNGAGRWVLDVSNSYSGATTVEDGALRITHGSALGTTGGITTVNGLSTTSSLEIAGGISIGESITLQGNGSASAANQLVNVSGNNTITANITNTTGGANHSITSLADKLTINASINPNGGSTRSLFLRGAGDGEITGGYNLSAAATAPLTKEGTGTWTLSGTSSYNGTTTITGGTLQIGNGGTTGRLAATSGITNNANLTINRSNAISQATDLGAGAIISGTGSLTQAGSGTTTLTAANTYSGATSVNAGTLHLASGSTASAITVASGASLGFTLGTTITSTSTVTLNGGATIKITGTPSDPSYTLITAASPITGTPVLDAAVPGYALVVDGNSLKLNSTTPAGFATWITGTFANGTIPGGQQGANDDPDSDGISNLLEYAIAGLDPTVSNSSIGTFAGLTLTFTKRTPLGPDLIYIIETSPDLLTPWTAQVTHGLGNTDGIITYTLPTSGSKLFGRLRVQN